MLVFNTIKPSSISQQLDHRISPEFVYLEKCTLKPPSQEVANAASSQLDSLATTWEGCFLLSAFSLLSAAKCRAWDDSSAHAMREVRPKITMVREVYESDYKYDSAEQYGAG